MFSNCWKIVLMKKPPQFFAVLNDYFSRDDIRVRVKGRRIQLIKPVFHEVRGNSLTYKRWPGSHVKLTFDL